MGKLTLAVGQPGVVMGRDAVIVRFEAATAGVLAHIIRAKSEVAAMLDRHSAHAIKTSGNIDGLYSGSVMRAGFRPRQPGLRWRRYRRPFFLETLGGIGALRAAWKGCLGPLGYIPLLLRGHRYHLEMIARRREWLLGCMGKVKTVRIEGAHIQSDLMGIVKAELTSYSAPSR